MKKKYSIIIVFFVSFFTSLTISAQGNLQALLPMPNNVVQGKGVLQLTGKEKISCNSQSLAFAVEELQQSFSQRLGMDLETRVNGTIKLSLNPSIVGREEYRLTITPKGINIDGKSPAGVLYGVYTLDQILMGDVVNTVSKRIKSVTINDKPAYELRALMLDPARNFIPIADVKHYIRQMARFKYNTLQMHLTDDQGWRIEIKSHPRLTEVGAFRVSKGSSEGPDNGYYTQAQMKELIDYATKYNVEIIPEIDIPGHTAALLTAYPKLRCDIYKDSTFQIGKVLNMMLSAANDDVYRVLDDVIREIADIFPSKKLHLGGDESAISSNWSKSPENRMLMKEQGYNNPAQLMGYFFNKVFASTHKYGLNVILWCEFNSPYAPAHSYLFDYPKDVTLVTWRNGLTPTSISFTHKSGNALILAPGEFCYLDYPQYKNDFPEFNNWGMPTTTFDQTYKFDPTYNLKPEERNHILGVMGTLWGEAIKDVNRATYMTYPRGLALAEAGWNNHPGKNIEDFKTRMLPNLTNLISRGVSVRVPFELYR